MPGIAIFFPPDWPGSVERGVVHPGIMGRQAVVGQPRCGGFITDRASFRNSLFTVAPLAQVFIFAGKTILPKNSE
jgi:hypothetical protein